MVEKKEGFPPTGRGCGRTRVILRGHWARNFPGEKSWRKNMADTPPLTLVGSTPTHVAPPATLREPGRRLWQTIMNEYDIGDAGGLEVLAQICATQDRVENLK